MTKEWFGRLTLVAILAATVLFAVWVRQYKAGASELDLDDTVRLAGDRIEFAVGSHWKPIDAADLPGHVLAGWHVPSRWGQEPVTVYVRRRADAWHAPQRSIMASVIDYVPHLGRLEGFDSDDTVTPIQGFSRIAGSAVLMQAGRARILALELVLLPDGSVVDVGVVGSIRRAGIAERWARQLVQRMQFTLPQTVTVLAETDLFDMAAWRLTLNRRVCVNRRRETDEWTVYPLETVANRFWSVRAKSVHLPQYRQPVQLVRDALLDITALDDSRRMFAEAAVGELRIFKAVRHEAIGKKWVYLILAPDRSGLLLNVTLAGTTGGAFEAYFDRVVAGIEPVRPVPAGRALDASRLLAEADLGQAAAGLAGWFEMTLNGTPIGFYAIAPHYDKHRRIVRGRMLWYRKFDNTTYISGQSQWEFAHDLSTGRTTSRRQAVLARRGGLVSHAIEHHVAFDQTKVDMLVRVDRQDTSAMIPRPKGFVCDGADMMLLAAAGSADGRQRLSEGADVAMSASLSVGLAAEVIKRVDRHDDLTGMAVTGDSEFGRAVYLFDRKGIWQGMELNGGLTIRPSSKAHIQRLFPSWFGKATKWLRDISGGGAVI